MPDGPETGDVDAMTSGAGLRVAFFLTSYGSGEQLLRLVRILRRSEPLSPIVIHHDEFQSQLDRGLFDGLDVHILTSDHPIVWGDMTLEAARWRVFRWILDNLDVDWVMLLSEQDYPVAPLSTLRSRLAESGADAVIEGQAVDDVDEPGLRHELELRYYYQYVSVRRLGIERRLPQRWQAKLRHLRGLFITAVMRAQRMVSIYTSPVVLDLPSRVGLRRPKTLFTPEFRCWYNDDCWYALSRTALQHIVDYVDAHPEFVRYYTRTVIPIESATATIVFNDPALRVENATLHAIRWTDRASGRPDVFVREDLDFLVGSGAVFARKFDPGQSEVLDALDAVILSNSSETP